MLYKYGLAVSEERGSLGRDTEIARYLAWEYGDGTGIRYLLGELDGSDEVAHPGNGQVHGRFAKWLAVRFRASRRAVGRVGVAQQGAPKL